MAQIDANNMYHTASNTLWDDMENPRLPVKYLASLFSAGDTSIIQQILKKMMGVRLHRRMVTVGDMDQKKIDSALQESGLTPEIADGIYRLTSLSHFDERFVIPPAHREEAIEMLEDTHLHKGNAGFGFIDKPERGL
jgi:nitrate reductase / nitrite oxidoreductase, beta subunit